MKKSNIIFCSSEILINSGYHYIRPCLVSTRSHLVPRKKIFGFVLTLKRRRETFSFSFFVFRLFPVDFIRETFLNDAHSVWDSILYFNQNQIILQQSFENCDFCETRINKLGNQIYKVKRTIYFCTIKLQFCQ